MKRFYLLLTGLCLCTGAHAQMGFSNATTAAGLDHAGFNTLQMGGGSAWFDYDADGDEDLIAVGGLGDNKLYRNDGNGQFTDVTAAAGLGGISHDTQGVVTGDIDNDGFREIFISTVWHQPNYLFKNNGDGTFTDISISSGVGLDSMWVSTAAFGDYDGDGLLDLYRGNYVRVGQAIVDSTGQPIGYAHRCDGNSLFHNNGDGTFTDIAQAIGIADTGCALSVVMTDYDRDHDPDFLIANDFGAWVRPNSLYQNQFPAAAVDVSASAGANQAMYGMGIAVGDYDHDEDLDYYITDIGSAVLLQQQPGHTFIDMAQAAGVDDDSIGNAMATGWGDAWIDIDNDTWQDLFISHGFIQLIPIFQNYRQDPDKLYRSLGNGLFQDLTMSLGLGDTNMGRGMCMSDYDRDGDMDMFVNVVNNDTSQATDHSQLYRNDYSGPNHWLQVETRGTVSNRDGFGTILVIDVAGQQWVHEVVSGGSHMSQHSSIAHFGTAADTLVDSLWVVWPTGHTQLLTDIPVDQRILVVEDTTQFLGIQEPAIGFVTVSPNPFSTSLTVQYMLHKQGLVTIEVVDMGGRVVQRAHQLGRAGVAASWTWDGSTAAGQQAAAGMYLVRLRSGREMETLRVVKGE